MDTKILCLAVLARGPASGYEIKKTLEQPPHCLFQDTSFGSIYPALKQLAREGAVTATSFEQQKRPDKKVFSITDEGMQRLKEALGQPLEPDRLRSDFLFTLLYGDLLPPALLLSMIDARIAELNQRIAEMEAWSPEDPSPSCGFLYGLGLNHYRACLDYLTRERPALAEALGVNGEAEKRAAE